MFPISSLRCAKYPGDAQSVVLMSPLLMFKSDMPLSVSVIRPDQILAGFGPMFMMKKFAVNQTE